MKQKEQLTKRQLAAPYIANFIGSIIAAIGINAFFIPHHLLSSGIGGAAIMVYYATGLPFGMGNFIMNIPVLIACYRFMGRRYTILAIIGTFIYSFILDSLSFLADMSVIHDPMTAAITGGILNGIGMGIIYRYNGNTGGLDVVGAIVKKFYSFEMGNVVMAVNTFILIFAAYMFGLELAVLTFIGSYVTAFLRIKWSSASTNAKPLRSLQTGRNRWPASSCATSVTALPSSKARALTRCRKNRLFMLSSS